MMKSISSCASKFAFLQAERLLQLEEFIDPEIVAVILQRTLVIEWALHPGSLAHGKGGVNPRASGRAVVRL